MEIVIFAIAKAIGFAVSTLVEEVLEDFLD